jgi:hypothetical protein
MCRRVVLAAIKWSLVVAITLGGIEIGLRLFPDLIPLILLQRFQQDLRTKIAQRRHLQNESQVWILPRDDGGPTLKLFKPFTRLDYDFRNAKERGSVYFDAHGFCNPPEYSYDVPHIDMITVGDSFTWCMLDMRRTWSSQLAALTELSVYNLGRGGIGPYEYLQILKRFGLPKQPKFVVMNIYEGNDLRDSVRYHEHVKAAATGKVLYADAASRAASRLHYDAWLDNALGRHSYALNFFIVGLDRAYALSEEAILQAVGDTAHQRVNFHYRLNFTDSSTAFNLHNADKDEVRYARRLRRGEISLEDVTDALRQFVALSRQYGFQPIVSYSPSAYTTYADVVTFEDQTLNALMPWYSRTQREFFRAKAKELGFVFVDTTPNLQAAARMLQGKTLLYYPINVHFTEAGHRVVAETLARVITAQTTQ